LPPFAVQIVADKDRPGPERERVEVAVHTGRR